MNPYLMIQIFRSERKRVGEYWQMNNRPQESRTVTPIVSTFYPYSEINPLGDWIGGPDVDCGVTNRKLGFDMSDSITGGGLHGKDLPKADA